MAAPASWDAVALAIKGFANADPPDGYISPEASARALAHSIAFEEPHADSGKPVWAPVPAQVLASAPRIAERMAQLGAAVPEVRRNAIGCVTFRWKLSDGRELELTHGGGAEHFQWCCMAHRFCEGFAGKDEQKVAERVAEILAADPASLPKLPDFRWPS